MKLIIHNAAIMDSGEYCCEADGIATRARLDVRGKYSFYTLVFNFSQCKSLVHSAECLYIYIYIYAFSRRFYRGSRGLMVRESDL